MLERGLIIKQMMRSFYFTVLQANIGDISFWILESSFSG